jgi:type IX secretion system PorP/SprF family membrane protein
MKKYLLLLLIALNGSAMAQQSAQYTQYAFNGLVINPAYAGSKGILNISALYRTQWVGLEGAPSTQTLSLDGALLRDKIGLGLHVFNDQAGAQGQKSVYASTAFRVKVGPAAKLAVGLAGGASQYYTDGTKLHPHDLVDDPTVPNTNISNWLPDTKAGLFFNTERFFAGLSAANVIGFRNKFINPPKRHFFLTSGYVFDLNETFKLKPSFLLKEDFKSPASLDLNTFLLIGDRLWLGGTYRTAIDIFTPKTDQDQKLAFNNSWALLTEIYISPAIRVGYAHDFSLSELSNYSTHEVSIGFYFFPKEKARSLTIRYF